MREEICRIREKTYTEEDGSEKPWLEEEEFQMLMIRKGTLSEEERAVMESHVVITDKLLSEIRFSKELSHVREWAGRSSRAFKRKRLSEASDGRQIPMEVASSRSWIYLMRWWQMTGRTSRACRGKHLESWILWRTKKESWIRS